MANNDFLLDPSSIYKWKIVKKSNSNEITSDVFYFKTGDCLIPSDFSILNIEDTQSNIDKIHIIEWEDQSSEFINVTKYLVFIGFMEESLDLVYETNDSNTLSYTFNGVLNTNYVCVIRQINDCGIKDTPIVHYKTKEFDQAPTVSIVQPTYNSIISNTTTLIWQQQKQKYFKIYIGVNSELTEQDLVEDNYENTTYFMQNLISNTFYYWKIIQVNDINTYSTQVSYFKVEKFVEPPTNIQLLTPQYNQLNISWNITFDWNQENAEYYDIIIYKLLYQNDCETFIEEQIFQQNNIINKYFYLQNILLYTKSDCLQSDSYAQTHGWKVIQKNSKGTLESPIHYFRLKSCNSQPIVPIIIKPELNNTVSILEDIEIQWSGSQNTMYYDIYLGLSNNNLYKYQQNVVNTNSYLIDKTTLDINKTYYIKIIQYNECGYQESNIISFITLSCLEIPSTPILIFPQNAKINIQLKDVSLVWNVSQKQNKYQLYFGDNLNLTEFNKIQNLQGTSYTIQELNRNTTYYWKVIQENDCGLSHSSQTYYFKTQDCTENPSNFNLLSPSNLAANLSNSVLLVWENQEGQAFYDIYIKKSDFIKFHCTKSNNQVNSYLIDNLEQDTIYEWYIIQRNYCGDTKSNQTNRFQTSFQKDCLIPISPKNPYPQNNEINVDAENIALRWQKSIGKEPIKYTVYLDENQNPSTILTIKDYDKQTMSMYCKYTTDVEDEKIENKKLVFSSYNIQNDESLLYLFPLIQPRRNYSLSYERYIYFKQENISLSTIISNLRLYLDFSNSYVNFIEMYFSNSVLYTEPKRQNILSNKMKVLQNLPLQNNIMINGNYSSNLTFYNTITNYCILQLKINTSELHNSIKTGTLCLQYDEFINNQFSLEKGKQYYWKVVQENECGKVESEIWKFTTKE